MAANGHKRPLSLFNISTDFMFHRYDKVFSRYYVHRAANGVEARSVADQYADEEIQLVLTDVVMPQMGGQELAKQLRISRPAIPVIFTSGYTEEAVVRNCELETKDFFIQKPYSPITLCQKVREVLDIAVPHPVAGSTGSN